LRRGRKTHRDHRFDSEKAAPAPSPARPRLPLGTPVSLHTPFTHRKKPAGTVAAAAFPLPTVPRRLSFELELPPDANSFEYELLTLTAKRWEYDWELEEHACWLAIFLIPKISIRTVVRETKESSSCAESALRHAFDSGYTGRPMMEWAVELIQSSWKPKPNKNAMDVELDDKMLSHVGLHSVGSDEDQMEMEILDPTTTDPTRTGPMSTDKGFGTKGQFCRL
jgi:hypothetical protein